MKIVIGFTGTRDGMSIGQKLGLSELLARFKNNLKPEDHFEFHHGNCVGADAEFDWIVRNHGFENLHIHPSTHEETQAFCITPGDVVYTAKRPLVRDREMVDVIDYLIATPKNESKEEARSGTWATIRYAKAKKNINIIILPRFPR